MFTGCTVPTDGKETKLVRNNQKVCLSADKNSEVALVPYCS